jgi:hypothetical protein
VHFIVMQFENMGRWGSKPLDVANVVSLATHQTSKSVSGLMLLHCTLMYICYHPNNCVDYFVLLPHLVTLGIIVFLFNN